ncbi:alpha-2-macroglobulin family protein [Salmonella enterica subsp. enterica serovar 4,[5],12:i:-]|uniref:Alpha-2-macroglobulin n=6 Tax=Salmonella enterica TaxID=28901 RepID=A0A625WJZ7_SALEN|nr:MULTISPECIES: alpha-2-macroglobulin [Salmonella]EAB9434841.1 alpha-2-macroglobulin family protein [Salmonella enterica subsp. enterica serovar Typhimurium str. UK-1]EBC9892266.1 alpha-2-macroglobulin family protein [Salmonella enterica subsp. enterica serovar Agona]EBH0106601.1 alpha-2-macroglobulin family protein [Salmonella enterica subsp. enterica serovar 4:i:-]EBH8045851.1 alpha-2-macroglobulin family protein [Salmonella bongori]EBH9619807.1 alpha-2-macroglobulin family protein [Salmone
MKHLRVVACMIMLALAGCDNNDKTAPTTKSEAPAVAQPSPAQDPAQLQKLAQQSQGKALTLLDASEAQLDGAATLVLTFSIPLDPEQDFSRVVHVVDKKSGSVDGAWELAPNLKKLRLRHLEPERVLVVTVDPAVKALNNATFGKSYEKTITTRDVQPSVGFASRGSLLPGKIAEGLPVMALNVNHVDVNFFRVKPGSLASFVSQWEYRSSLSNWESDNLLKMADLVYTGRFDLNPARNTREKLLLPLSDIKPLQQAGVYVAVMNQAGHYNYSNAATLFTLSDIGVSAHRYHNRLDIFTQSLENGAAQSGIEIVLLNDKGQTLAQATSDAQGHVQLEADKAAALLLARKEEQTTLLDLTLPALDLSEFNVAGAPGYSKQFFMFGPRDLYRPGETVILNGLLRDSDGKTLPDQPVKLEVVKPDGQVMRTVVSQPENGLYRLNYPLDINAPTGLWHVRANTGDNLLRSWDFHVEDFMPERMALNLTAQKTPLAPADEVKFSVVGYYLYGAPANGNTLQGQLFLRPLRDAVAALPGFQFGNIAEENLSRSLDEVQLTLDKGGRGEVSAASQWQEAHSPLQVILQASLLESGGRPVTRRVEQAIWPADTLPGIRPQFAAKAVYDYRTDTTVNQPIVDEDSNAAFDIVYANAQGEKKAVSGLQVRLIRERRDYYWNWSESEGWQSQFDQKDLVEGEQTLDLNADETGKVSFPVEWGAYRLEVKAPNETVSSVRFWAGYSWQDNSDGSGAARPDRVTLKLDKANYRPGDTMKLHIAAPVAGKGYAMVESSDGPLWWQAIDVPAQGLELTIPVDKTWNRHDLYLSTLVVRPGDKSRSATPKRAVGLLHLPLGDDNRRLDLALESPAKMRPNQPLTVRVKASVKHGEMPKQINVLVSAVDSGVLNITDYATPDPWQAFFGQKRYGADIYDIYGQVIEGQGRLAALRFGGDGDDLKRGGKPPVNHVNIIAQQAQPITLNEQGEGVVTLPIGDFNGELRVMAQAWTADDFGRGESKVVVAAPVIAELNMPRFLAGGDVSRLVLDVTNLTDRPQTLNIALAASGLLELLSQQPQPVNLAPGVRTTLFVPVRALEGFGEGEIQATISGLNLPGETLDAQHKQWQIGVRPAWPAQTVNSGIALAPGESWHVPEQHLANISPATLQGQLLLSGKPPLNLARYIRELKAYPYGCLEQTTSGLFPALYTNAAQLQSLGITGDSDEKRRAAVDIGISRILQMQRDNGGFALWDENGAEEPWLTAYAMDFLIRAGEQGYSVPPEAINRGNERLLRYLQDPGTMLIRYSDNTQASTFAAQAYAALVLARQQKAPLGTLREIWERRSQAASGLPLMQLGIALNTMGDARRGEEAITLALNTPRQDERQWIADYGSSLRDNALMLSLLEENNLRPDAQNALLSSLSEQAFGQRWLSTQENNALFLAAHSRQASAGAWQVQTSLEAQPLSGDKALTRNLDADQLAALEVTNTGSQPLWLRLDSSGYPSSAPEPASNVLQIERQILGTDGQRKSLSSLRSGELVLVWLTVVADRNVPDALVVDLLPAGLELENQNLADSSASLPESGSEVQNLLNQMQQADIQYMEFRDDRFVAAVVVNEGQPVTLVYLARAVTPGTYQLAQPQVESMYAPQWRATGASEGLLIVTP